MIPNVPQGMTVIPEPKESFNPNIGRTISQLIDKALSMPRRLLAGPTSDLRGFAQENGVAMEKIDHLRKKGEYLMEFHARTGISLHQILNLDKEELARLVAVAEESEKDNWVPGKVWAPSGPTPARPANVVMVG